MQDLYYFVSGPLVWIAFLVFIVGSLYRLADLLLLAYRKEKFLFSYFSLKFGLRSIAHWMIPFGTVNMRRHPVMTVATFAFHICLFITPIFLMAHILLVDESWNLRWISLPNGAADVMTVMVLAGCLFFLYRRIRLPEVRFVTTFSDYLLLAIVAAPFATGFWAYHQLPGYPLALILHILSGEIMLAAIPFTRLSHMLFAPFTRAYMGSEFGGIRNAKDW